MVYRSLKRVKQLFALGVAVAAGINIINEFISRANDKLRVATI